MVFTSERVSVGSDEDLLSILDLRHDGLIPVGKGALDGQLERLEHGEFGLGGSISVPGVLDDVIVVRVVLLHGRGRDVEGATPDFDLFFALNLIKLF